jgi:hypothetical protein
LVTALDRGKAGATMTTPTATKTTRVFIDILLFRGEIGIFDITLWSSDGPTASV